MTTEERLRRFHAEGYRVSMADHLFLPHEVDPEQYDVIVVPDHFEPETKQPHAIGWRVDAHSLNGEPSVLGGVAYTFDEALADAEKSLDLIVGARKEER